MPRLQYLLPLLTACQLGRGPLDLPQIEARGPVLETLRAVPDGTLYRCADQQILVLRGSPREMGQQHGLLLRRQVQTVLRQTLIWCAKEGLGASELAAIHQDFAPHLPQRYKDELAGLAEGAQVPLRQLELLHAMPSKFHCSGAAVSRSMTRDGGLYHARSLDYSLDIGTDDRIQNHALLLVRVPDDGIPNAVPSWAGFLGAVTGLNSRGISIGEKGSACRDESYAGIPMIFMVREALRRARSLEEALAVFRRGPRTCGYNFILGSGDERQAVALEVTRSEVFLSRMGDLAENVAPHTALPDAVRRSNHFVGRNTARHQRRPGQGYDPARYMRGSWERYQQIGQYLLSHRGQLDTAGMVALLRQYARNHPCLHQAVMDGGRRHIWVAQAKDPRQAPFPGAQNQDFVGYDLMALVRGEASRAVGILRPTATRRNAPVPR